MLRSSRSHLVGDRVAASFSEEFSGEATLLNERRPRVESLPPFGPNEKLAPRFERFMFTPGAIFFVFRKKSPIGRT
jgi:hypothetical protein